VTLLPSQDLPVPSGEPLFEAITAFF